MMPPSRARPTTSTHASSADSDARVNRDVSTVVSRMPVGLPTTNAATMPSATGSCSARPNPENPPTDTPAEKKLVGYKADFSDVKVGDTVQVSISMLKGGAAKKDKVDKKADADAELAA